MPREAVEEEKKINKKIKKIKIIIIENDNTKKL